MNPAPQKTVLKSATFWTTNGPAGFFAYFALFEGSGQPMALRLTALILSGLLFGLHAFLRTVNKNPFVLPAMLAGLIWRKRSASKPNPIGSTTTT